MATIALVNGKCSSCGTARVTVRRGIMLDVAEYPNGARYPRGRHDCSARVAVWAEALRQEVLGKISFHESALEMLRSLDVPCADEASSRHEAALVKLRECL